MLSSHRCHHPEIDLTGPGTATGVWALEDVVVLTDVGVNVQGAAFYTDQYVKEDDRWLIAHTGYRRTYEELMPRAGDQGPQADRGLVGHRRAVDARLTIGVGPGGLGSGLPAPARRPGQAGSGRVRPGLGHLRPPRARVRPTWRHR